MDDVFKLLANNSGAAIIAALAFYYFDRVTSRFNETVRDFGKKLEDSTKVTMEVRSVMEKLYEHKVKERYKKLKEGKDTAKVC